MSQLVIDLDALRDNIGTVAGWMERIEAHWTVVTKVLCGHSETLKALQYLGVRSMGDSRIENLQAIEKVVPDFESWYLRLPHKSVISEVVELADVSLNSEIEVIKLLNAEAAKLGKTHRIIIMIELGDLREGILPGHLVHFYQQVFELSNIEVLGIGANLGCLAGAVPNIDQFMQLILYRELLELKFKHRLPLLSAGSSAVLPLVLEERLPSAINHFRIGESLFLGTDLVNGGTLDGLRDDVVMLEAEVAEIKEKSLTPQGETANISPFEQAPEEEYVPGQRGYRALVDVGQLDTDVSGLTPANPNYTIAGASSDITVLNLGENPNGITIGDHVRFKVDYSAFLRLMNSRYVDRFVKPSLAELRTHPVSEKAPEILPEYEEELAAIGVSREREDDS